MNLFYGQIAEVFVDEGMVTGKVRVGGVSRKIPLDLILQPTSGDQILICDGIAIAKVETGENNYVSSNPR